MMKRNERAPSPSRSSTRDQVKRSFSTLDGLRGKTSVKRRQGALMRDSECEEIAIGDLSRGQDLLDFDMGGAD
jgi:hypothetical protein